MAAPVKSGWQPRSNRLRVQRPRVRIPAGVHWAHVCAAESKPERERPQNPAARAPLHDSHL
eukprot:2085704-Prymnesium_polylepis.1